MRGGSHYTDPLALLSAYCCAVMVKQSIDSGNTVVEGGFGFAGGLRQVFTDVNA
jgi:hypothetical protein